MASKLLSRARAVSARLRHPRTLSPTLAAFAPKRLLSDVAPRPLPAAGDSPPASASPTPQSSGSAGKFKDNAKGSSVRSSLKDPELVKFSAIADTWWDSEGPFKLLHRMNPTRLAFIRSTLCRHFGKDPYSARPFEGLKIVDVGCGGGILSEPLARMGALVTGVDAVDKNIKIARIHAVDWLSQVMLEIFAVGVFMEKAQFPRSL